MSSILTNTSAMVALQTLKGVNQNLSKAQDEISTGKSISSAKDNAAVWAISTVMKSDVTGFQGISSDLSLGTSTVAVARQAAETVTDLLTQMKSKIVSAQQDNVDRTKIQTDVDALRNQIKSVVGAAQFNGLNLVNGKAGASVNVLASLDRDSSGGVTASKIAVKTNDLSVGGYTAKAVLGATTTGVSASKDTAGFTLNHHTVTHVAAAGSPVIPAHDVDTNGTGQIIIDDSADAFEAGDQVSIAISGKTITYTVSADDVAPNSTSNIVAVGLNSAINAEGITDLTVNYASVSTTAGKLSFTNAGAADLTVSVQFKNAGSGGLAGLSSIDVSTSDGATAALGSIEGLIKTGVDAAASFGSSQKRIDTQKAFVSKLTDSLKTGIGSLVDANMEEASARLQALQVQQQLAVQSLSIANKAPQSILSLFR